MVAGGLEQPVYATFAPNDDTRMFVVERRGRIRVVEGGQVVGTFLDIEAEVHPITREVGMFGMAFDPLYADNGRFFVSYVSPGGDSVVAAFRVSDDPDSADPTSLSELVSVEQPFTNHNGGMIAFGPDGCLYLGLGDGGDAQQGGVPDVFDHAQNPATELGSMLRIDPDNPGQSAPGNVGGTAHPHVWDYGLRNPWRFSFDRQKGDLYIGDVGETAFEGIEIAPAGTGQLNYGWARCEGPSCSTGSADSDGRRAPAFSYDHGDGDNCVIGGYVYRGDAIPSLVGRYLFSDHGSSRIWSLVYDGEEGGQPSVCDFYELTGLSLSGHPVSFAEDNAGELYVIEIEGSVFKITPASP
jgi:glucose/arabinose dehydrogenase